MAVLGLFCDDAFSCRILGQGEMEAEFILGWNWNLTLSGPIGLEVIDLV